PPAISPTPIGAGRTSSRSLANEAPCGSLAGPDLEPSPGGAREQVREGRTENLKPMIDSREASAETGPTGGAPPLAIRLLGPWDVRLHGRSLRPLRSRKGEWLLALLVLHRGRAIARDWLAGTLWPDSPNAQAL